jgi:hypothetical protein
VARTKGPKEWQPGRRRLEALLAERTVTTEGTIDEDRVRNVAIPSRSETGWMTLTSWHVTDDPENMLRILREGGDLQDMRPWGDLCGGLYVSAAPQLWRNRSRRKWEFVSELDAEKRNTLADLVLGDLKEKRATGYITRSEFEVAERDVRMWLETGHVPILLLVTNQPYNVDIVRLARENGIADPFNPFEVEVVFAGRFIDVADGFFGDQDVRAAAAKAFDIPIQDIFDEHVCRLLREAWGYDGAFTRASMVRVPQLVIWNTDAILKFGNLERGAA